MIRLGDGMYVDPHEVAAVSAGSTRCSVRLRGSDGWLAAADFEPGQIEELVDKIEVAKVDLKEIAPTPAGLTRLDPEPVEWYFHTAGEPLRVHDETSGPNWRVACYSREHMEELRPKYPECDVTPLYAGPVIPATNPTQEEA